MAPADIEALRSVRYANDSSASLPAMHRRPLINRLFYARSEIKYSGKSTRELVLVAHRNAPKRRRVMKIIGAHRA